MQRPHRSDGLRSRANRTDTTSVSPEMGSVSDSPLKRGKWQIPFQFPWHVSAADKKGQRMGGWHPLFYVWELEKQLSDKCLNFNVTYKHFMHRSLSVGVFLCLCVCVCMCAGHKMQKVFTH